MRHDFRFAAVSVALLGSLGSAAAQSAGATPGGPAPLSDPLAGAPGTTTTLAPDATASDRSTVQGEALQLDDGQKQAILQAVNREKSRVRQPGGFDVKVGGPVPPSIELYSLPDNALIEVPVTKLYKYTMVHDQVVLVDPIRMRIVDVLK